MHVTCAPGVSSIRGGRVSYQTICYAGGGNGRAGYATSAGGGGGGGGGDDDPHDDSDDEGDGSGDYGAGDWSPPGGGSGGDGDDWSRCGDISSGALASLVEPPQLDMLAQPAMGICALSFSFHNLPSGVSGDGARVRSV